MSIRCTSMLKQTQVIRSHKGNTCVGGGGGGGPVMPLPLLYIYRSAVGYKQWNFLLYKVLQLL